MNTRTRSATNKKTTFQILQTIKLELVALTTLLNAKADLKTKKTAIKKLATHLYNLVNGFKDEHQIHEIDLNWHHSFDLLFSFVHHLIESGVNGKTRFGADDGTAHVIKTISRGIHAIEHALWQRKWTRVCHFDFPPSFKAATKTLLVAATAQRGYNPSLQEHQLKAVLEFAGHAHF